MLPSGEVTFHIAGVIPFVFVSSVTADELFETLLSGAEVAEAVLLASPVVVVSDVVSAVVVVADFELLSVCELSGTSPHEQRSAVHIAATVKRLNVLCIFFMVLSPVFIVVCFSISHIEKNFKYGYNFVIIRLYSLLYAFLSFPYLCRIV